MTIRRIPISLAVAALALLMLPAIPASASSISSHLLTITDMPAGWSITHPTGRKPASSGCLAAVSTHTHDQAARATVAFAKGQLPVLAEALATGTAQQRAWTALERTLGGCRTFTATLTGSSASGSVGELSFPAVGTRSSAYAMRVRVKGVNVDYDIVLFQAHSYYGFVAYGDLGTPSVTMAEAFAKEAVAKAEGMPVTPPSTTTMGT